MVVSRSSSSGSLRTVDALGGASIKDRMPRTSSVQSMHIESTGCLEKAFFLTTSEVHATLCCGINMGVMEDPVRTPCDHLFCRHCVNQWLERSKTCPTCREALEPEQLKKERNIGCLINDLEVGCAAGRTGKPAGSVVETLPSADSTQSLPTVVESPRPSGDWHGPGSGRDAAPTPTSLEKSFATLGRTAALAPSVIEEEAKEEEEEEQEQGCQWLGKLEFLEKHLQTCEYTMVDCPLDGCTSQMERRSLPAHEGSCVHRIATCEYCEASCKHCDLQEHVNSECKKAPKKVEKDKDGNHKKARMCGAAIDMCSLQ